MQQTIPFNSNLHYLITVNYQRMMAFEQAAFVSNDENLRSFYEARAGESEAYLGELCTALNINESSMLDAQLCNDTLKNITAKKNPGSVLQFIISFEKIVMSWYKKVIADRKNFPVELAAIVSRQQQSVGASAMALHKL
jgi:hypothetical protein